MVHIKTLTVGDYQTNCYIVWGEDTDRCIVIDPGYEPKTILQAAEDAGKKIDSILLTHGHFDHVGGLRDLAHQTGCRIYLNRKEELLPDSMTGGMLFYSNAYADGDTLQMAGLTLEIIHTPGHTPGSVCIAAEDVLFSGDTLFAGSIGRTDFPGGDVPDMKKSLAKLGALPVNYRVYPGHGESTTIETEKAQNPFLRGTIEI